MTRKTRKAISHAPPNDWDPLEIAASAAGAPEAHRADEPHDGSAGGPGEVEEGLYLDLADDQAADQRVACDHTQVLVDWYEYSDHHIVGCRPGKRRKNQLKFLQPAHVVAALVQNGADAVMGRALTPTCLRLASFPHDDIRPARRTLAAMGGLSQEVTNEHLVRLCRPWRPKGERHLYPPLFFTERRPQQNAPRRMLTYYVPNLAGWRALIRKVFQACEARKRKAHAAMEETRQRKQEMARRARAARATQHSRRHGRASETRGKTRPSQR